MPAFSPFPFLPFSTCCPDMSTSIRRRCSKARAISCRSTGSTANHARQQLHDPRHRLFAGQPRPLILDRDALLGLAEPAVHQELEGVESVADLRPHLHHFSMRGSLSSFTRRRRTLGVLKSASGCRGTWSAADQSFRACFAAVPRSQGCSLPVATFQLSILEHDAGLSNGRTMRRNDCVGEDGEAVLGAIKKKRRCALLRT